MSNSSPVNGIRRAAGRVARRVTPLAVKQAIRHVRSPRVEGPLSYNQDGLATIHNADFRQDERFAKAYAAGERTGSWGGHAVHWRMHVACWAADSVKDLPGDFVECGVNRGGLARTVIEYVNFASLGKTFYLLDTFNGLVEKYITPEEHALGLRAGRAGGYEECYDQVCRTFAQFPVKIIRGMVPETLPQADTEEVCFLSIDMNCVEPEIEAAKYFWPRLVPGAIVVLDDYAWPQHIAQKHAFDAFAREYNVPILSLPTGQGLIIKR